MATISRDYPRDFDSRAYIYDVLLRYPKFQESVLTSFHKAFAKNEIRGRRLLDIGTGPSAHSVISASAFVDEIFLSDIAPQNLMWLSEWQHGKNEYSLKPLFKLVVDIEGKGESPDDRERSVREKISGFLHIDILKADPLQPSVFPEFDVITSCLCFEAASQNIEEYKTLAENVKGLLKKGGHLVLYGYLENDTFKVGEHTFQDLSITLEQIKEIWKGTGMNIVFFEDVQGKIRHHFMMVAEK